MTDAHVGRVATKGLVDPNPAIQIGRVATKALVQPTDPNVQVGRVAVKALIRLHRFQMISMGDWRANRFYKYTSQANPNVMGS